MGSSVTPTIATCIYEEEKEGLGEHEVKRTNAVFMPQNLEWAQHHTGKDLHFTECFCNAMVAGGWLKFSPSLVKATVGMGKKNSRGKNFTLG